MGTGQQAKFIGHGIGLEINEAPVLAPRIKQELEPGMVLSLIHIFYLSTGKRSVNPRHQNNTELLLTIHLDYHRLSKRT